MSPRTFLIIALALVFGSAAAYGVWLFMKSQSAEGQAADSVSVVMTAEEIPRGGLITAEEVTTQKYPRTMVPEGALTKLDQAIGRTVAIPMIKGEPVLNAKLSAKGAGSGLAALIPKGMRAMTIQTPNVATGVAGLIMPGNKVDVMMTVTGSGGANDATGGGSSTTLLQQIEILAVDQRVGGSATDKKADMKEMRSVTLLVTPQQAAKLNLGQSQGILHLSLRNPDDDQDAKTQPVTMSEMRFHQDKPWDERLKAVIESYSKAQKAKPPVVKVESPIGPSTPRISIRTIRGSNEGSVSVESVAVPRPIARRINR